MKKMLILSLVLVCAMSLAAQNWELDPSFGDVELESGFLPDPHEVEIIAGGSINLDNSKKVDVYATGYVAEAPDVDFYYSTDGDYNLTISVDGAGEDTILLINGPDGEWYFDDDSAGGSDPQIIFRNPDSGLYSIWIGSYYEGEYVDVTLKISEM